MMYGLVCEPRFKKPCDFYFILFYFFCIYSFLPLCMKFLVSEKEKSVGYLSNNDCFYCHLEFLKGYFMVHVYLYVTLHQHENSFSVPVIYLLFVPYKNKSDAK